MSHLFEEYSKNSDIGIVRLSYDLRLIDKNAYSEMYANIPRNGANFANKLLGQNNIQRIKELSLNKGSYILLDFDCEFNRCRKALAVRIKDDEIAIVFHTTFSMAEFLGAEYSCDALRVISQCIANMYEKEIFGLYDVRQPTVFPINTNYLSNNRNTKNIVRLSDCAAILKSVSTRVKPSRLLKIELSAGIMTRSKCVDIALLTYAISELFASSIMYSAKTPIKLTADTVEGTVTFKASGKYLISDEKSDKANLRFVLVAGVLSAMGISTSANVNDGIFEITVSVPTECEPENMLCAENTVAGGILSARIFDKIMDFIGLCEDFEPIKVMTKEK